MSNRRKLAKCVLWPIATYSASTWAVALKSTIITISRAYSRAAKCCLRLPWRHPTEALYNSLRLPLLETFAANQCSKFIADSTELALINQHINKNQIIICAN